MSEKEIILFAELCICWLERNSAEDIVIKAAIDSVAERTSIIPSVDDVHEIMARVIIRIA